MNILVLHSQVPFAHGGAEVLVYGLVQALRERGHRADIVALPYCWNPPEKLLDSALAWRLLDLETSGAENVDLVICTKFPTWAARHPRKVLWLVHQHRQAYDLFGSAHSEFTPDMNGRSAREAVFDIDRVGLSECFPRFGISKNVVGRLERFTGIKAEHLYPPVPRSDLWPESYEPFVLSVARLDELKRVEAIIAAWRFIDTKLRLVVVSDGPLKHRLMRLVEQLGLAQRIEFLGRVPDGELSKLYRTCRAVYYAPIDEDYGYAAVEALSAGKPVVTAPDSGGVLEFVVDGATGSVSELEPEPLSAAVNQYVEESLARHHGSAGRAATAAISWDRVVDALTGRPHR